MDWSDLRPVVEAYARGRISWDQLTGLGDKWLAGSRVFTDYLPATQQERALRFVLAHPGCTTAQLAKALTIANASPMVAHLRDAGRVRTERKGGRLRIWAAEFRA
jgi:hypothetical protein